MPQRKTTRAICNLTLLVALAFLTGCPQPASKPDAGKGKGVPAGPARLEGTWQGTLAEKLRLVVSISKSSDGAYNGIIDSVDQGSSFPIDSITFDADKASPTLRFSVSKVGGIYEGTFSKDRTQIAGAWTQGGSTAKLIFTRAR